MWAQFVGQRFERLRAAAVGDAGVYAVADQLAGNGRADGGRRVLFLSGPDAEAKQTVSALITRLGFAPVDLGGVEQGRLVQFPGGPLAILNLVKLG